MHIYFNLLANYHFIYTFNPSLDKIAMSLFTNTPYRIISTHNTVEVRKNISNQQNALFSLCTFIPGDVISDFSAGTISPTPTYLTIQIDVEKHISLQPTYLQYTNHSCNPNVFFNTTTFQLIAIKELNIGDELVFFYPSTEWKMTQPFDCYCGSVQCIGTIAGASVLSDAILHQYTFTDFIQTQLANKKLAKKVA
jgi:hypothetical protein